MNKTLRAERGAHKPPKAAGGAKAGSGGRKSRGKKVRTSFRGDTPTRSRLHPPSAAPDAKAPSRTLPDGMAWAKGSYDESDQNRRD